MSDLTLTALAERQHGLVSRVQALEHLSRGALDRRIESGRTEVMRSGVYRIAGTPRSWEQALHAAVLAGGLETVASHRAAAGLWELAGFGRGDGIEITSPRDRRVRLEGVRAHQSTVLGDRHITTRSRVPVTTVARTLCDLTAVAQMGEIARALDDALRRRITTLPQLQLVFDDLATKGRRRSRVMHILLAERADGIEPGESAPEQRVARWLVAAGLPRPVQQHRIELGRRAARIDLAYPKALVAIEYDGWDYHRTRTAFDRDRARANELEVLGWVVLRFTSTSSRADVVALTRAALDQVSIHHGMREEMTLAG